MRENKNDYMVYRQNEGIFGTKARVFDASEIKKVFMKKNKVGSRYWKK